MAKLTSKGLLKILVGRGFLTKHQVADCIAAQKEALGKGEKKTLLGIAVEKGYLTEARKAEVVDAARSVAAARAPAAAAPAATPTPPAPPAAGPAPEIPGFKIETEIGRGAMGTVYRGRQVSLDRPVAIKILAKSISQDESFVERFLKEAKTAARLNHPNVVGAIDAGEISGTYYFIMEYIEGKNVKDLLDREGPFSEQKALEITDQIADALAHAETLDMVHRDIKPENIMVTADGTAKLSDLGLARQMLDPSATMAGKVIGTPHYMSPEQVEGLSDLDVRSDIYSLGATLYQMLANDFPFTAATPTAVLNKHLTAPRPDVSKVNPNVSRPVCALVRRMMARDRTRRPQSAGELKEMMARARKGTVPSQSAAPASTQKKSIPVVPLIVGGGALVAAAALILVVMLGGEEETPPPPPRDRVQPVSVRSGSEVDAPATAGQDTEREAKQTLISAREYWEEHPKSPLAAIERFEEVARQHPDTKAARDAASETSAIRLQIDGALTAVKGRVDQLLAEGDFKSAEQAYGQFLASFPRDPWQKQAEEEIANVRLEAQKALKDIKEKTEQLVADGKSAEAFQMLMDSAEKMTAETARTVSENMKALEKDMEEAEEKRRKREALLADARTQAVNSLEDGGLQSLMETCERLKEDRRFKEALDLLAKDEAEFQRAVTISKKAEQGATANIGEEFTVQGITGTIASVADGIITLKAGQVQFSRPIWKLKSGEILKLADVGTDGRGDPLGAAMFYMCRGEYEKAGEILDEQTSEEAEVQTAIFEELASAAAEADAKKLIASFRKYADSEKWADANSAFETLRDEYGHTKTFAAARADLEKQGKTVSKEMERSSPKSAKRKGSLEGFVVDASPVSGKKGAYRGKYEFNNAKELQDWEVEKGYSNSDWEIEDGLLMGRGRTRLRNNIPFVGNLVVEANIHSGSNFALYIGNYKFAWFRYRSFGGSKVRMRAYKDGVSLSGEKAYYNIPVGMIRLRWVKQGNTIAWYREGKKIQQIKEKGRIRKNSTIRLETASYYYYYDDDDDFDDGDDDGRRVTRVDSLSFMGMVDLERLEEFKDFEDED